MILRFFKAPYLSRLFIALLLAVILWLPVIFIPENLLIPHFFSPFYKFYMTISTENRWIQIIIAFIINVLTALIVNFIATEFGLSEKRSYVSLFLYILFSAALPQFTKMNPLIFINLLLSLYLYFLFRIATTKNTILLSFNGGLLIGIMTLVFVPMIFLLVVQFIGLMLNRINKIRAYLTTVLGLLIPFIYLFTYYFWIDTVSQKGADFLQNLSVHWPAAIHVNIFSTIIIFIIIVLIVSAIWKEYINLFKRKISKRRNTSITLYMLLILLFVFLFYSTGINFIVLLFVPAAIITNDYLRFVKRKKIAEIIVLILVVLELFNQYFILYNAS